MSKEKASDLVWDDWNINHIKKHRVIVSEVEEAYKSKQIIKSGYKNRLKIYGATKLDRYLTIIVSFEKQEQPYVVSARDMSRKERMIYDQETKAN